MYIIYVYYVYIMYVLCVHIVFYVPFLFPSVLCFILFCVIMASYDCFELTQFVIKFCSVSKQITNHRKVNELQIILY